MVQTFETARLPAAQSAARRPMSFTDQVGAAYEGMIYLDNFNARNALRDRILNERIDEVERVTGTRLDHPRNWSARMEQWFETALPEEAAPRSREQVYQDRVRQLDREIEDLRAARPEYATEIRDRDFWNNELTRQAADIDARSRGAEFFPGLVGGLGGAVRDPVNAASMPLGFTGGIVKVMLGEAAINTVIELGNLPVANSWRVELGLDPLTTEEMAMRVGFAAGAGAALPGAVRGAGPLVGRASELPGIRNSNTVRAMRLSSALDGQAPALGRLSSQSVLRLHLDTVPEPPAVDRGARAAIERDLDVAAQTPFERSAPGDAEHFDRATAALEIAERAGERGASAAARLTEEPVNAIETVARASSTAPTVRAFIDPRDMNVDAETFQFKDGGDSEGVTDRLANVTEWDPVMAGTVMAWRNRDGELFIADGHQRRGLAARLIADNPDQADNIRLETFIYDEAAGFDTAQVRALAARRNIAEGTGTAIDAAKVMRDWPELFDEGVMPRTSAMFRQADALRRLSLPAFALVKNEIVQPVHAAVVGRLVTDPDEQVAVLNVLARAGPNSEYEAEAMVRQALAAGFERDSTQTLFGEEFFTESLITERAKVLAQAARILQQDRRVFQTLTEQADTIESAGNTLSRGSNEARAKTNAQILQVLQRLANRAGPVGDALGTAARAVHSGVSVRAASREFAEGLANVIERDGLNSFLDDGGRGSAPSGPAHRADDPGGSRAGEVTPEIDDATAQMFDSPGGPAAVDQVARLDEEAAAAAAADAVTLAARTTEFNEWFEGSRVTDAAGDPLRVFRGEHGEIPESASARSAASDPTTGPAPSLEEIGYGQYHSRLDSLTFTDDPAVASVYALDPNDPRETALQPRVLPVYLRIARPIMDDADDPFMDMSVIDDALGRAEMLRFASRYGDQIANTNNWFENFMSEFASVDEVISRAPERVRDLFTNAYILLDDPDFVAAARAAGYDGAIHRGSGESLDATEYRVFDASQARSVLAAPARGQARFDELADTALRADLRAVLDAGADLPTLAAHPLIARRLDDMESRGESIDEWGDLAAAAADFDRWNVERVFDVPGRGAVTGVDDAMDTMIDQARTMAWWDDGLDSDMPAGWRPAQDREATFLIGWTAAGKSTIANPYARAQNAAIVDGDEFKKIIPGYDDGAGASYAHREASQLTDMAMYRLMETGDNLVIPTVGASPAALETRINALRDAGYTVKMVEMVVDRDEAIRRNVGRFLSTNRLVPLFVFNEPDLAITSTYRYILDAGEVQAGARVSNMQPRGEPPRVLEDPKGILDHVEGLENAGASVAGATRGSLERTAADARPGSQVQGGRGQSEPTQAGEQALIDGVSPVTAGDRQSLEIETRRDAPMRGGDEPAGGLFSDAERLQQDMFSTPVGVRQDESGAIVPDLRTDQDIDADLAAEDGLLNRLRGCVP